jgi:hypothetical protein
MALRLRKGKTRKFSGKSYQRTGLTGTPKNRLEGLKGWARFQRDVNGNDVRIVEEKGEWEAYIRKMSPSEKPGQSVTIHTLPDKVASNKMFKIRRPKATKVRVPDGDVVGTGRNRHLRLY